MMQSTSTMRPPTMMQSTSTMARSIIFLLVVASALSSAQAFLQPAGKCATVARLGKVLKTNSNTPSSSCLSISQVIDNPLTLELELEPKKDEGKFNWFKAWYPIVPVEILDAEVPHKFQLLGMDIVVWNDAPIKGGLFGSKKNRAKSAKRVGGQWRAFVDACPHRKVPLSEGRVEDDGSLMCSYHAWRFSGDGQLVAAPQLEKEDDMERVKSNPKSNCNAFPTQVNDGVLWVWPESGDDARLESALKEAPLCQTAEGVNQDRLWVGPWNFRELPYGADYFIENVVDPAHVSVSHHNVVGSRYADQTIGINITTSLTKDGFAFLNYRPSGDDETSASTTYTAPSTVQIDTGVGDDGAQQTLELYASPSRPGFCNHVGRMVIVKDSNGKMPAFLRTFTLPVPKWLSHVLAASFLNQDGLFLHHQERTLAKTGAYTSLLHGDDDVPQNYNKAVLPIEADKGVLNYRNWLRLLAGGRIPYKYDPAMPAADNEVVFDQWNGHTKYCHICQTALANLKKVRLAAFFTATCLVVLRPGGKVLNLIGVLVTAGLGLGLNKLIGLFYRFEFSHGHND